MRLLFSFGVIAAIASRSAHAEPPSSTLAPESCVDCERVESPSAKRRVLATALAVFPGAIVHGVGTWTVRENRAAKKLLYSQAIGLGIAGGAAAVIFTAGGSKYTIFPGVPLIVAGTGIFAQSWLTDIWAAAGGSRRIDRPLALPPWSIEVGTSWLHDAYRDRTLIRGGGQLWLGRVGLAAEALVDSEGDDTIGRANVTLRMLGAPATGTVIESGSRLFVRVGTRYREDDKDGTTEWAQEIELRGRLDLDRIDNLFRSSFAELGVGLGALRAEYDDVPEDWSSVLLAHFGWGAYLGSRGEAMLYYEHTRDSLAGGMAVWRASGFVGSVGAVARVRVVGPWELRGEIEIGNAYVTTFGLAYRGGR